MQTVGTWWMWLGFLIFVAIVVSIDVFFLNRKPSHKVTTREALSWVSVWVTCALIFNLLLWWYLRDHYAPEYANQKALEFFSGYLIEQSLSIDNMFAFIMIFNYLHVPHAYQRRVLLYGVLSAIFLRFVVIISGTWLVNEFRWILYLFGLFLVFTGIRMLIPHEENKDLSANFLYRWVQKHIPMTRDFHQEYFFIKQNKKWYATPLFLVLVLIEVSDLIFAFDSIPAIFAITRDPFIVFTSNIFAILGLRALYFLLANMANRFYLLKYGIAIMLTFIGVKMLIAPWIHIPIPYALAVVAAILGTTVLLSVYIPQKQRKK